MRSVDKNWKVMELQNVADIIMGQSPSSDSYNTEGLGLPFFQGKTDFSKDNKYPVIRQWTSSPTKISEAGNLLFTVRAPVGELFFNNIKACIGRGLASISAKGDNSQEFLYYCLQSKKTEFEKLSQGSTFTAINSKELKELKVSLPSLSEQKKIAEILSKVDEDIEKTDEVIKKTEKLKAGLLDHFLEKNNSNVVPLKELFDFKNGVNFSIDKKGDRGILVVDVLNMFGRNNILEMKNLYRVDNNFDSEYFLKKDDILFVRSSVKRGGVGWASLFGGLKEPVVFCGFLIRARMKKTKSSYFVPDFLVYFLRNKKIRRQIINLSGGVAITNINQASLGELPIPLIPKKEQQRIAEAISKIDKKIDIHEKIKSKLEILKKGLMQDLLAQNI